MVFYTRVFWRAFDASKSVINGCQNIFLNLNYPEFILISCKKAIKHMFFCQLLRVL